MADKIKELVPPVKFGEILELPVHGIGKNGDPIVKVDKYIIFVKLQKGDIIEPNSTVKIKVNKVLSKFGFAILHKE